MAIAISGLACLAPAMGSEHSETCRYCRENTAAAGASNADQERTRHYAPDRQVDVRHIKLDVTPNFEHHSVAGTATLRFAPIAQPLTSLRLDAVNLTVKDVRSLPPHLVRDWSAGREDLTIVFEEAVPVGADATVEIEYSAEPLQGLYFCTPDMGLPASDRLCWTQGETHEARHWFPCFDYPNERASTELIAHVPAGMTVVSNGRLISETKTDDEVKTHGELKTVHWLQEKPHVSYLICLLAGNLEKIEARHKNLQLGFYTQPSRAKFAESGLRDTAEIMAFYEQEIGIDYPWDKYDQCTIPDFMWGGMENTSITTLAPRTLYENADDTPHADSTRSLNAHELAHQWFGDYVTCKDWSHLWLNEGFATYYALLFEGHKFGRDALLYGLYLDARDDIFDPKHADDHRPIVYREYERPKDQFDFRNYPKASWVLHMLRSQVGEDLYRKAIKNYLERYALAEVETENLRKEFESLSGKPLDQFFDQWLYHGGHPRLKIDYKWLAADSTAHVTIEQLQATSDDVLLFEFPTKLRFVVAGKTIDEPIEIKKRKQDFYVRLPAEPEIVRFDPDYTLLAEIDFKKSDPLLTADLKNESDMMGRIFACEALARRPTAAAVTALTQALQNDPFFGVRRAAATALRQIGTTEAVEALVTAAEQDDARVRRTVIDELGKCYQDAARKKLHEVADKEKLPIVAAAAIVGLGRSDREHADAAIRAALASRSFNNERLLAAFLAIRETGDPEWSQDLMQTLKDSADSVESQIIAQGFQTLAKISQRGRHQAAAYEFLAGYLDHRREPIRLAAIDAIGNLHDTRARALLAPLASTAHIDRTRYAAKKAITTLDKQAEFLPPEVGQLRTELQQLRDDQEKLKQTIDELKAKSTSQSK